MINAAVDCAADVYVGPSGIMLQLKMWMTCLGGLNAAPICIVSCYYADLSFGDEASQLDVLQLAEQCI